MKKFILSDIYIYPIKSLGGIRLEKAFMEEKGLQYDRRWMLVNLEGMFITQRKYTELSLLQVRIASDQLTITHQKNKNLSISFPLNESTGQNIAVTIWDNPSHGLEVSKAVNEWFSVYLGFEVMLVKMPESEKLFVDKRYAQNGEIVSFSDGYPSLIIGQSSLDNLNEKLVQDVKMNRFRPNFVFLNGEPHIEDKFKNFQLGSVLFSAVKPCARCVLTTVDQETGIKGQEPLRTLSGYRTFDKKVLFGQNLIHKGKGYITVGDELQIKEWK